MPLTVADILAKRREVADKYFKSASDKIDILLLDFQNGFYGEPVVYDVSSVYVGPNQYWPFVFELIQKSYGGFTVTESECKTKIKFAASTAEEAT